MNRGLISLNRSCESSGDSTQLLYLRARYYVPQMGRFISRDPSGLEANLYSYGAANPIIRSDPTGLFSVAMLECFDLHSGTHGVYGSEIGIVYVSAQEAVDTCKRAYDPDNWNRDDFNLSGDLPTSARDLFGWFLFSGSSSLFFDAHAALTKELSRSKLINNKRLEYYLFGGETPAETYYEYRFNLSQQFQCFGDWIHNNSLPISCVLGSFYYQIKTLDNGASVGFRIDNRTDLESGTHIAGRFPPEYEASIEELIDRGELDGDEALINAINRDYSGGKKVISILDFSSGPSLVQTYVWKEKHDPCQAIYWGLLGFIPSGALEIEPWIESDSLTISPY